MVLPHSGLPSPPPPSCFDKDESSKDSIDSTPLPDDVFNLPIAGIEVETPREDPSDRYKQETVPLITGLPGVGATPLSARISLAALEDQIDQKSTSPTHPVLPPISQKHLFQPRSTGPSSSSRNGDDVSNVAENGEYYIDDVQLQLTLHFQLILLVFTSALTPRIGIILRMTTQRYQVRTRKIHRQRQV